MGRRVERIGAVLPDILKRAERQREALASIRRDWPRLVGRRLSAHTKPVSLRQGRLIVHAERPADSFAFSYQRARLLDELRARGSVEDIIVRPGAPGR